MASPVYEDFTSLVQVSKVLTNEKLSEALTEWFGENMTFTHWEYVSETGKGDSYLSELIRIRICGKTSENHPNHVQVILKNIPQSLSRRLTFRSDEFFENEIMFYSKVLPKLLEFQSSKNMTDPFDKYVKLFLYHCDGVNDVICLIDASLDNFGSAVRQQGIDIEHSRITMKIFAQFHAMSFAMKDQNPEEFNRVKGAICETYYDEKIWDWYGAFWGRLCGIAIDAVEKECPNSIYLEKIKKFAVPETYQAMIKAVKDKQNGVISHGDSWTNNFLYKYENGRVVDGKMIDFQLTRCASPILDISFFIYACTTQDLREKHYDELIELYYNILSKQIQEMGSDPQKVYPREVFLKELKCFSFFGLGFSMESTPVIVLEPEDAMDMNIEGTSKLNINDIWQLKPYKTREGRIRFVDCVKHAVDMGYI